VKEIKEQNAEQVNSTGQSKNGGLLACTGIDHTAGYTILGGRPVDIVNANGKVAEELF
jgi:hypothetical protein